MKERRQHYLMKGFSLIEVMIVVAIIAIIAAVAYPSYRDYVTSSQRAVAKTNLLDISARQAQYFANNKTFASTLAALGLPSPYYVDGGGESSSANALYQITLANVNTTAFDIIATPQNSLASADTLCGTYTLDETDEPSFSNGGSAHECW